MFGQSNLLDHSTKLLLEAQELEGDFQKKIELAEEASAGFKELGIDSLYLDSELLIATTAKILKDSVMLFEHLMPALDLARRSRDTGVLVEAYNLLSFYNFAIGDAQEGMKILKIPHQNKYYSADALEGSITNLGALIDVGMVYTMNLDTVYEYVNQLQVLADKYDDPSVQVVSRFKLAYLFSKADNYRGAVDVLKEAAPYIGKVENKGFLHYYYENMIKAFINLNQPDSAIHYIGVLKDVASYGPDDPRNCYILVAQLQCDLLLGTRSELPQGFDGCFERSYAELDNSRRVSISNLNTIYVKCQYLNANRNWNKLDPLLKRLIDAATTSNSNAMLRKLYELQYQSYRDQGLTKKALEAHIQYTKYAEVMSQYVFTQSEAVIRNQMNLKLAEKENNLLQIENQNQQLRIERSKADNRFYISGFILISLIAAFLYRQSSSRAKRGKELSELVDQRTHELKLSNDELLTSNQKLVKSNVELENFAHMASHDLKTPLHNIIKFSKLVSEKLKNSNTEGIQEYLGMINSGGQQMDLLISDVLDYSLLSKNGKHQDELLVDLNVLINEIQGAISEYIIQNNAKLIVSQTLSTIEGNRSNLFVLFKNLIENGIKYNDSETPQITIFEQDHPTDYMICVKDNGIGIKEEYRDQVFEMFTRLHGQNRYEGTGIGLASCKKIVEEMNGTITIESRMDEYTTFIVTLPKSYVHYYS